jgi:hypothetical protein
VDDGMLQRSSAIVPVVRTSLRPAGDAFGGHGWFLLIGDAPREVVIDHNTISHSGSAVLYAYGGTSADPREMYGVRLTNNAMRHNAYGINGDFFGYGNGVISGFSPDGTVSANYLAGGPAARYPAGNLVTGRFEAGFVNPAAGDFRLRAGSELRNAASDGGDIGADAESVQSRVAAVETGVEGEPPVARPANLRIVTH